METRSIGQMAKKTVAALSRFTARQTGKIAFTWALVALIILVNLGVVFHWIDSYYESILIFAGINVILATSLNLINGITGQLAIGHAGFMAVGAYVSAILSTIYGWSFLPALFIGGLVAAVIGFGIGLPTLRLRGDYLAIATLGFGEIIRVIVLNLRITRGARGLPGIPLYTNFFWVEALAIITIVVLVNIVNSSYGRAMIAVRENEIAAENIGINTTQFKVLAFTIGAFFAGVAGGLFSHHMSYISPHSFTFLRSIEILLMVVLGGMGSMTGAIVAAFLLTGLPEMLRVVEEFRMVAYSLALILLMLFRPQGLMGTKEVTLQLFRRALGPWAKSEEESKAGNVG